MTGAVQDGVMGRSRGWLRRKAAAVAAKLHEHWGRLRATRAARLVIGAGRWIYDGLLPRGPDLPNDPEMAFAGTHGLFASGRVILLLFFIGFLGWAAFAPLDSAILAPGVIVVESPRKSIQHLEGGIVQDIPVKDGQDVKAGQLLMRLDDTQPRASLDLLKGQGDALAAQDAGLLAERDGRDTIGFPASLT